MAKLHTDGLGAVESCMVMWFEETVLVLTLDVVSNRLQSLNYFVGQVE